MAESSDKNGSSPLTAVRDWWQLIWTDRSPKADSSRLVTIAQLPVYGDELPARPQFFVEEGALPLQSYVHDARIVAQDSYDAFAGRFATVNKAIQKTKSAAERTAEYATTEWTVLPKTAAIVLGGMAGFVFGLRRTGKPKVLHTLFGFATMATFCYPNEAVDLTRCTVAHARKYYSDFKLSPIPSASPNDGKTKELSPPK